MFKQGVSVTFRMLFIAVLMTAACIAQAQITVIHAGTLIAEPGKPVQHHKSVVIAGGVVKSIEDGYVGGDTVIDLSDQYVLPGLIDMHTHVTGPVDIDERAPARWVVDDYLQRQSITALNAVPVLKAILLNGFTTIRNLGDPASVTYDLRDAIASGKIAGPRMFVSEVQFETSGGDYEASASKMKAEIEPFLKNRGTCSGVDDCRRAVREEVKRGADVIKIRLPDMTVLDPRIQATVEYPEELNAIVETSHRLGRTVAVHVAGVPRETMLAAQAGVDTIEHGPLDDDVIAVMKAKGIGYTPTVGAMITVTPLLKKVGITRDLLGETRTSVRKARAAGIRILFGTDLPILPISEQAKEFTSLVEAGLSPSEALMAATVNAAKALHMETTIGSIGVGKAADIVAVKTDPLTTIQALESMSFVMKGGEIYRSALHQR